MTRLRIPTVRHLLVALVLGAATPAPAAAQKIFPGLIGGAAGLAAGGYVSIGIWTLKAQHGEYLYSVDDALGWEATPVLVGPAVGFTIGLFDEDRLRRTLIGGAIGGVVGTGVGVLIGASQWRLPEGRWAGGVVGGAAGILAGSLVGLVWPGSSADGTEEAGVPVTLRIPVGF